MHVFRSCFSSRFSFQQTMRGFSTGRALAVTSVALGGLLSYGSLGEAEPSKPPYTFVFYDNGELEGLLPIASRLQKEGRKVQVLTMDRHRQKIKEAGLETIVDTSSWKEEWERLPFDREATLSPDTVFSLNRLLKGTFVVSGVASAMQKQVLEQADLPSVAFWDNFSAGGKSPFFATALKIQKAADRVFYPSCAVARDMEKLLGPSAMPSYKIVGNPSIEQWAKEIFFVDRQEVRRRLALSSSQPVVTYMAGYDGDEEARLGFELFAKAWKLLQDTGVTVVITTHPKSDGGNFERAVLKKYGCTRFILSEGRVSTQEAVAISQFAICHKTTASVKVLGAGIPVIHLVGDPEYSNPAIEADVAAKVESEEEFLKVFRSYQKGKECNYSVYDGMGMPKDSEKAFLEALAEVEAMT